MIAPLSADVTMLIYSSGKKSFASTIIVYRVQFFFLL